MNRKFKVLHRLGRHVNFPRYVQWDKLGEERAQTNHNQSLEELNRRGGLSPREMMANILDVNYWDLKLDEDQCLVEIRKIEVVDDKEGER